MADEHLLTFVLAVAGLGASLLVAVSSLALFRRQSLSYFLVTLAIVTFLFRSFLGVVMLGGLVSLQTHHLLEHTLDAVLVGFLFMAVYAARTVETNPQSTARYRDYDD